MKSVNYVLVFNVDREGLITLVRKKSPPWQAGKLNLPGGHIEEGEDPKDAAIREYLEEIGDSICVSFVGKIEGPGHQIWCYKAHVPVHVGDGCEDVVLKTWSVLQKDPTLLPNLKLLIPLYLAGSTGWVLHDLIDEDHRDEDTIFEYQYSNIRVEI